MAQLAELARFHLADAREHARRHPRQQVRAQAARRRTRPGDTARLGGDLRDVGQRLELVARDIFEAGRDDREPAQRRRPPDGSWRRAAARRACARPAGACCPGGRRSAGGRAPRSCRCLPRRASRSDRRPRSRARRARSRTLASASSRRRAVSVPAAFTRWSGSSNCGLTSTTPSAPARSRNASARSMLRAATKLTSTVKKSNGPSATASDSRLQSTPSSDVTRGSARSDGCSWPWPDVDREHAGARRAPATPG